MKKKSKNSRAGGRFIYGFTKVKCQDQSIPSTGTCDTDPTSPVTATTTHFGF